MDKLNTKKFAYSLAIVSAVLYLVCAVAIALAPEASLRFFAYLFHGIDITQIAGYPVSMASTIIGFIEIVVGSLIVGWLFAAIYNKLG